MKSNIRLKPLKKYLCKDISPKQLARLLDELAYDYTRITLRMQQTEDHLSLFNHPEASDFLYHLKLLRDVLRKCKS